MRLLSFLPLSGGLFLVFQNSVFALEEQNSNLNTLAETNTLSYALTHGSFKGLLRYSGQYRDSNLHTLQDSDTPHPPNQNTQQYSASGGYLGYETAPYNNISAGLSLYTSQPAGHNPDDRRGLGGLYEKDGEQGSYTVFGEVFFKYQIDHHLLKLGRQEMPGYKFVSLSDIRMTPITHEGIIYENTILNNFNFNFAYITKMKERNDDRFIDMARGAQIKEYNSGKKLIRGSYDLNDFKNNRYNGNKKQMSMASLIYHTDKIALEAWNYYVNDFVNTTYLYADYFFAPIADYHFTLSAQYALQKDTGSRVAGNIDTWFYGLKLQLEQGNFNYFFSYNEVDYNESSYDGGSIFVSWGTPQMFNSFQVQDSELAGTQSTGAGVSYQFAHNTQFRGLNLRLRYGDYNMPDKLSQKDARQDRTETTFDINYAFDKDARLGKVPLNGLSVQLRIAYNDYKTNYNFTAYKNLHGYDFDSVNDDFTDIRLYFNYKF